MQFQLFSLERWSNNTDQFKYIDTVTLSIHYLHTLVPMSPYLKKFLNSPTIGLAETFGKKSIQDQQDLVFTGDQFESLL